MKKILLFLIALVPLCVRAQMNTWERFKYNEINHPFTDVPDPDPSIDNQGNRWVLKQKSLWRIKGTDTTKFENFPNPVGVDMIPDNLSLIDGRAAFIYYSGSIENGYISYLGFCDGTELRFFSDSIMEDTPNRKILPLGLLQTKKYVWLVKTNKLIRFDRANSFKEFVMSEDSISNQINIPVIKTDFFMADVDHIPYVFNDNEESGRKILSDDTLRGVLRVTANTIYMLGKKKHHRYVDGQLESIDFPSSDLGILSNTDEFNKDFFAYTYTRGLLVVYKGQVKTYRFADYEGGYIRDYYNEVEYWSKTLDNGISVIRVAGGDENGNAELYFSLYEGKVNFEGKTTVLNAPFLYKQHNGDKFFYYTEFKKKYESYLTIIKNDRDSTVLRFPSDLDYPGFITADTNFLYVSYASGILRTKRNVYYMKGNLFYDTNKNGVKENNETGVNKFPLIIKPLDLTMYPDRNGNYSFLAETGKKYTLEIPADSLFDYVSNELPYVMSSSDSNSIGFTFKAVKPEVKSYLSVPWPRCSTTSSTYFYVENTGGFPIEKIRFTLIGDKLTKIKSANAIETKNDTLIFEVVDLGLFALKSIPYTVTFPGGNSVGKAINFKLITDLYSSGAIINSKGDSLTDFIRCSYDPNDKAVTPAGIREEHYTLFNTPLDYLIRFENTGNDTAYTVTIHDTLDPNLNFSTLDVIGSSHPVITDISKDGKVVFHFENIMLPDSTTNKEKAQGFVRFSIHPRKNLAENTIIKNKAGIVFDMNDPVITNEVYNTFVSQYPVISTIPDKVEHKNIVFPNPANEFININAPERAYVDVFDYTGKLVVHTKETYINSSDWKNGLYFFRLFDTRGNNIGTEKVLISR